MIWSWIKLCLSPTRHVTWSIALRDCLCQCVLIYKMRCQPCLIKYLWWLNEIRCLNRGAECLVICTHSIIFVFIVVVYPQCFRGCSGISSWKVSPSDSARRCPDTLMDLSSPRTHFSVWIPLSFGPPLLSTWILPPWRRDMEFVMNWQGSFFFFFCC